jgi:photosystem II stability/assembly factor-like uncharacterized protein
MKIFTPFMLFSVRKHFFCSFIPKMQFVRYYYNGSHLEGRMRMSKNSIRQMALSTVVFVFSLYAANVTPVWHSTNGPFVPTASVFSLGQAGQYLYAGLEDGRLFRSRADAIDWKLVTTAQNTVYQVLECGTELLAGIGIPFCPVIVDCFGPDPVTCFFGPPCGYGWSPYIMKSLDSGQTWTRDTLSVCWAFTVDKDTVFAMSGSSMYRRIAGSTSWRQIAVLPANPTPGQNTLSYDYLFGETNVLQRFGKIFVCATYKGVYKSDAALSSWTCVYNNQVRDVVRCGNNLVVVNGTSNLLWSSDTGKTWTTINSVTVKPPPPDLRANYMDCSNGMCLVQTTTGTMFSLDLGKTWAQIPPVPDFSFCFLATAGGIMAGRKNHGVSFCPNNSTAWSDASSKGLPRYFASMTGIENGGIITDTGCYYDISQDKWTISYMDKALAGMKTNISQGRGISSGRFMMVGNEYGITKSLDSGQTFTRCSDSLPNFCWHYFVESIVQTNYGILATDGYLYRSLDSGATWIKQPGPTGKLAQQGSSLIYCANSSLTNQTSQGALYTSIDKGLKWNAVQVISPWGGTVRCFFCIGPDLYAGTTEGVFTSADSGITWLPFGQGLPNRAVTSLAFTEENMFATLDSSDVYRLDRTGSVLGRMNSSVFKSASGITACLMAGRLVYSLPQRQHLSIEMFGTDGRLMRTLYNGFADHGTHELALDRSLSGQTVTILRFRGNSWSKTMRANLAALRAGR